MEFAGGFELPYIGAAYRAFIRFASGLYYSVTSYDVYDTLNLPKKSVRIP